MTEVTLVSSTNSRERDVVRLRISIIIPDYNRVALAKTALDSVFQQTRQPDEIIVIDDGSTEDVCRSLRAWHSDRVRYHYQTNAYTAAAPWRSPGVTS
jgi:glycosyltransferase involved in cell wall biosynthesis